LLRLSTRLGILLGVLVGALLAVTYSWTFTRIGRLDYPAALIARLSTLQESDSKRTPEARAKANGITSGFLADYPGYEDVRFEDRQIPTPDGDQIAIRIYTPEGSGPHPFYLDIHGGGWWMGDGFLFHESLRAFSSQADAIVVSVDYRLAPEHPYPTPLDDCDTALAWILEFGESIGGDPTRIAVGGGSAGGNLAAALTLRTRDRGGPRFAMQYLLVPATDLSGTRGWFSYDEVGEGYVITVSSIEGMIDAYVPNTRDRWNAYVSPLLEGDLSGLPPAFVVTAQFDPLRDQGEAYAGRLENAGVPVVLHREEGALHGFLGSPDRARRIQKMAARAIRAALHRQP
jgi:acetyl esterase